MAEETRLQATTAERELLTYREAAERLDLSADYVAHLVSRGVLHPVKRQGERQKYLHRDEVEWYGRRRNGSIDVNPYLAAKLRESAQRVAQQQPPVELGDLGPLPPPSMPTDISDPSLGMGMLLIVFLLASLLLSFLSQQRFDEDKLKQLKTAPQLQSWRRAIKQLAQQLPDEPAA